MLTFFLPWSDLVWSSCESIKYILSLPSHSDILKLVLGYLKTILLARIQGDLLGWAQEVYNQIHSPFGGKERLQECSPVYSRAFLASWEKFCVCISKMMGCMCSQNGNKERMRRMCDSCEHSWFKIVGTTIIHSCWTQCTEHNVQFINAYNATYTI